MVAAALSRHPDVVVVDERLAYRALTGEIPVDTAGARAVGFKIPRWTDLLPGPLNGEADQRLEGTWQYHREPSVFVIRDPLPVISSMHKLIVRDKPWINRYGVPLARRRLEADPELRARFGWVESLSPELRRWALGAAYWVAKNEAVERYLSAGYPMLPVSYEDLVAEPDRLRSIVEFLGLRWDPAVLSGSPGRLLGTDEGGRAAGGTDPSRPLDASSLHSGDDTSEDIRGVVAAVVGDVPARLHQLCAETAKNPLGS